MEGLCGTMDRNGPNDWVAPDGTALTVGDSAALSGSWLELLHPDSAR